MAVGKRTRRPSYYNRKLLEIVDLYMEETGVKEPILREVAAWAVDKGLMDKPIIDPLKIVSEAFARACRQDYVEDENGEPVRRRHAVKLMVSGRQLTFWPKMEDLTREKMRTSLQSRKGGAVQDVLQIERDRRFFNKHYNPGDPIEIDFNINLDVEEHFMPKDYPDSPPGETQEDGEPKQT